MNNVLLWLGEGKDIHLEVTSYNTQAIEFYMKFGFFEVAKGEYLLSKLDSPKAIPIIKMQKSFNKEK